MDTVENHGEQKIKTKIIVKDITYLATKLNVQTWQFMVDVKNTDICVFGTADYKEIHEAVLSQSGDLSCYFMLVPKTVFLFFISVLSFQALLI